MRSLSVRLLLSLLTLVVPTALFAHDVTLTGTSTFASLDGSSSDHDGAVNGVFTVNDGNLIVNGTVQCNDASGPASACAMAFAVSGDMTVNGALYAENRTGPGNGGAITLTVNGNLGVGSAAVISSASTTNPSGSNGGAITANVAGDLTVAAGGTISSASPNGQAGAILLGSSGLVTVNGNVLAGPSRTLLGTRLTGTALDGGGSGSAGGAITIASTTFSEPAVIIGSTANVVSQGEKSAGPVTIDGCGITVTGLVAALGRSDSSARVAIRSGKSLVIDGRDLGAAGTRQGRVRADALADGATDHGVDLFSREAVSILGPAGAGSLFAVSADPGARSKKDGAGTIRVISLDTTVTASGRAASAGLDGKGTRGGTISIEAASDVNLNTATLVAVGDYSSSKKNSAGGTIAVRSYSGDITWIAGTGDVRPVGSTSGVPPADQGKILLTACGSIDTTGSTFPVQGVATSVFPDTQTACSPAAPSLPAGAAPLITCNTPPVANDVNASTNEDNSVTITLSGSDADGDSLTFTILTPPANGSLGPVVSTGPTTADVLYTPDANYNGADSFTFQANDGNGGTDTGAVAISIAAVNDAPSFLAGPTVVVLEDSGAQSIANWATAISAGPADESGQTVTFTVTTDTPSLFSVQPAVSSSGTLTFTPAANANGTASITVVAQDDGGTANGGVDTSAPQNSSITVTAVNDEPSFTAGGDVTVGEDSGAYSAAWASAISAGPNEGSQTVAFVVTNDNNALFATQPAISPSGVLTFTPAANATGSAEVTVTLTDDGGTANGGDDTSSSVTFTITVDSVNDAPSFTSGGDVSVNEDSGAYSAQWATAISAGANETQNVSFVITGNTNPSLFSAGPSVSSTGVLTFTPAANAFGSATISIHAQDDGGTANGGDDTSDSVDFTITVNGINDAPSFTSGGDVTVNEDSGAYSAAWATAISAGPNEGGQTVSFNVSNSSNSLFAAQPSISPAGVLSFTPAANAFGTATVTVTLSDNGGTANGGVDTSAPPVVFTITINGINDPPSAGNDVWQTFGNTELRVDLGAGATPSVNDTTPSGTGVLDNDADAVEGDPFTITGVVGCADATAPFVCAVTGGTLTLNANGTFSFQPSVGAVAGSFQYTVTDQPGAGTPASAVGSVSIGIQEVIWYVNGSAAAGGNGTSSSPFNSFAPLNGADVDDANDYIFVHNSTVNGSIALEQGQRLWGEGVGLILPHNLNGNGSPTVLVPAGPRPKVFSTGDTVTIAGVSATQVHGLELNSTTGNAIDVTSTVFGPATGVSIVNNLITGAAAEGIDVTAVSPAGTSVTVAGTSITSIGNAFDVNAIAGPVAVSFANGTVASAAGIGINIDGSPAATTKIAMLANVTVAGSTAGHGIVVNLAQFDANPATAAIEQAPGGAINVGAVGDPVGGEAVRFTDVSGDFGFGALNAFGSTNAVTISGTGLFDGTNGFRVVSGSGNVVAPAGYALSITNSTIGAANFTLTGVSATGGANGIILNNTGTDGGLVVFGGGVIAGTTSDAILLTNTAHVNLSSMTVSNSGEAGILGNGVTGLSLTGMQFLNNGNDSADEGIKVTNLFGTSTWTNVTVNGSAHNNVFIDNTSGTLTSLTVNGSTFNGVGALFGANGFLLQARGTATVGSVTINGSTFNAAASAGVFIQAQDTATISSATISGNTVTNNGLGIQVTQSNAANVTFKVINNPTITFSQLYAINIFSSGTTTGGTMTGRIQNNQIGQSAVPDSGSPFGGGIRVMIQSQTKGVILVDSNVVRQTPFGRGIDVAGQSVPGLDLTLTNNDVDGQDLSGFPVAAIFVAADNLGAGGLLRADIRGNTVPNAGTYDYPFFDGTSPSLVYEEFSGATAQLVDTPPASADATAQLSSTNTGSVYANPGVALIGGPLLTPP